MDNVQGSYNDWQKNYITIFFIVQLWPVPAGSSRAFCCVCFTFHDFCAELSQLNKYRS